MEEQQNPDVVVIGLGLSGLYVSYLAAKRGMKVIGFEAKS